MESGIDYITADMFINENQLSIRFLKGSVQLQQYPRSTLSNGSGVETEDSIVRALTVAYLP